MTPHTPDFELKRQAIHMAFGLAILAILFTFPGPQQDAVAAAHVFTLAVLFYLLFIIDCRAKWLRSPFTDFFIDSLERKGAPPAHGALWYALGALLALTFLTNLSAIASIIFLLAIADGLSTLVGVNCRHFLPYNKKKTVEGTAAFFATGLLTYFFIGSLAFPLSLLATVVESLDLQLDDNLTIPLACIVFFKLAGV